jgi:hypothetical protein
VAGVVAAVVVEVAPAVEEVAVAEVAVVAEVEVVVEAEAEVVVVALRRCRSRTGTRSRPGRTSPSRNRPSSCPARSAAT